MLYSLINQQLALTVINFFWWLAKLCVIEVSNVLENIAFYEFFRKAVKNHATVM